MKVRPQHALITGGGGAIGNAIAKCLIRRGLALRITLVDIDEKAAQSNASSLGHDTHAVAWDLSRTDDLPRLYEELTRDRGTVDWLFNCAGIMEVQTFASLPWDTCTRTLRINLESPLRLMSLAVPAMIERGSGVVVNVTSMAGVTPIKGCALYGASKAGLSMASEIARMELAAKGVRVVTVYPGPVSSALERRARAQLAHTPATRWIPVGKPDELAERVIDACVHGKPRVAYPAIYDVASRLPQLTRLLTERLSPEPRV